MISYMGYIPKISISWNPVNFNKGRAVCIQGIYADCVLTQLSCGNKLIFPVKASTYPCYGFSFTFVCNYFVQDGFILLWLTNDNRRSLIGKINP